MGSITVVNIGLVFSQNADIKVTEETTHEEIARLEPPASIPLPAPFWGDPRRPPFAGISLAELLVSFRPALSGPLLPAQRLRKGFIAPILKEALWHMRSKPFPFLHEFSFGGSFHLVSALPKCLDVVLVSRAHVLEFVPGLHTCLLLPSMAPPLAVKDALLSRFGLLASTLRTRRSKSSQ